MSNIEDEIKGYLDTIYNNFIKFLICYKLFQLENKSRSSDVIGKENAEKNVEIMNKYNSIFQVLSFGMLDLSIFELSKIFEKQNKRYTNKTISLITLKNVLKNNRNEINEIIKVRFNKKFQELKEGQLNFLSIEEIKNEEGGEKILDEDFFNKIDGKILKFEKTILNLKNTRDNKGHNLEKQKFANLTYNDINEIKKLFNELFNFINNYLWRSEYNFNFFEEQVEREYSLLLKNLLEYNKIRSLIFNNKIDDLGKTDADILIEIKTILKIDF